MNSSDKPRLVFATGKGRICPGCGKPTASCACGRPLDEPVKARLTVKLRHETRGRKGKGVTVIDGLPRNAEFLETLSRELKKVCGAGGAIREGLLEIQGDHREKLREHLADKGFAVKG